MSGDLLSKLNEKENELRMKEKTVRERNRIRKKEVFLSNFENLMSKNNIVDMFAIACEVFGKIVGDHAISNRIDYASYSEKGEMRMRIFESKREGYDDGEGATLLDLKMKEDLFQIDDQFGESWMTEDKAIDVIYGILRRSFHNEFNGKDFKVSGIPDMDFEIVLDDGDLISDVKELDLSIKSSTSIKNKFFDDIEDQRRKGYSM